MGSSHGSPDGPSQEPSPPPTPAFEKDPFWDSSYDVVGKLEKMYLDDYEKPKHQHGHGVRSTPMKPDVGFNSNQAQPLTDYQIRAIEVIIIKISTFFFSFLGLLILLRINLFLFVIVFICSSIGCNKSVL
jgi:hypothetical protein